VAETLHVMRPKLRRPQCYPLSPPVGEAILRYLRDARPRCEHRAVFLTIKAPFRPLSGSSISAMVRIRLRKQGVKLDWIGAHCLRHSCAGRLLHAGFTLKQIAVTSGVNLTENHRFEFPHFAANVDLRRIAGGVWAFSCPTTLVATCTLDRRPR
jgi:integrase